MSNKYLFTIKFQLLISLFLNFTEIYAQNNFSGLRFKCLKLIKSPNEDMLKQMQQGLPSASELPNWPPTLDKNLSKSELNIDSVIVIDDSPVLVLLQIFFSGLDNGTISIKLTGNKPRSIQNITSFADVQQGQSPLEISLEPNLPENVNIISNNLSVKISSRDNHNLEKEYIYSLNKKWLKPISVYNLNQTVLLNPIGSALHISSPPLINKNTNQKEKSQNKSYNDLLPHGPSKYSFSLWDNIKADVNLNLDELSNVNFTIYPDLNPNSETFYILPKSYQLIWTQDDGLKDFKIMYLSNNDVKFYFELGTGINNKSIDQIKNLIIKQNLATNPKIVQLGNNEIESINLKNNYLDANLISIHATKENAILSWTMSNKVKDELVLAIQNGADFGGTFIIGEDSIKHSIPLSLALNNKRSYGRIVLEKSSWRQIDWQNKFPLPIKIRYLHILFENPANTQIFSWDCNNTIVPSLSKVNFNATRVPIWFDTDARVSQIWLQYDISECINCIKKILDHSTIGLSESSSSNINIEVMDLFSSGVINLQVVVKSNQLDPKQLIAREEQKTINKDNEVTLFGPLFLPPSNKVQYQYKLYIQTKTNSYTTDFITSNNPQLFLIKAEVERILGKIIK